MTFLAALVLAVPACSGSAPAVPPASRSGSSEYGRLAVADLQRLAPPIEYCIGQRDTPDPAFHGCMDWHSAVHATFALFAISRLTGNPRYRDIAAHAIGGRKNIARAVAEIKAGDLSGELPYGYGWSLILDTEARIEGDSEFDELASVTSTALTRWLSNMTLRQIVYNAASQEYLNTIWPIVCLLIWARVAHQQADRAVAIRLARYLLRQPEQRLICGSYGGGTTGFFAPCSLLALTAWLAGDSARASQPILSRLAEYHALPQTIGSTPHSAGLNFSRSWGDIAAYELTGLNAWRLRFQMLFGYEMGLRYVWAGNYLDSAHWVAQFGVFAIWLQGLTGRW